MHFLYALGLIVLSSCSTITNTQLDQKNENYQFFSTCHSASLEEWLKEYQQELGTIDSALTLANRLPEHAAEWYRGTAYFMKARACAHIGRVAEARENILFALNHRFRNDGLIRIDSIMLNVIGLQWLDSIVAIWVPIHRTLQKQWQPQPIILKRALHIHRRKPVLIIALHGGNGSYEEFATHFSELPNEINAVIAFPAGLRRISYVANSWPEETSLSDSFLLNAIDSIKRTIDCDTSQVYLIGYSQGAATSIGLALRHPGHFRGVVLFSGFTFDSYSDSLLLEAAKHHISFYALCGEHSESGFRTTIKNLSRRCTTFGIRFHYEEHSGMLHEVPLDAENDVVTALHWIQSGGATSENVTYR